MSDFQTPGSYQAPGGYPLGAAPAPPTAPSYAQAPIGYPGYPGYPGGPPPQSRNRGRVWLIVGIAVGALVLGSVGVGVVATRVNNAAADVANGPRRAIDAWLVAGKAGDLESVRALTCGAYADNYTADDFDNEATTTLAWDITSSTIGAASATVVANVSYTVDDKRYLQQWTFNVVNDHGWKFCGLADIR